MAKDISKRLYVQDIGSYTDKLSKERFSDKALTVKIVDRGIILPVRKINDVFKGGVCDSDLNFVTGYSRRENNGGGGHQ